MTDREKLIELMEQAYFCSMENLADHLIANGVVVREKGEWVQYADDKFIGYDADGRIKYRKRYTYECPCCGKNEATKRNFCPNCGADMRGAENDG